MKKRRILALGMAAVMAAGCLFTGCGSGSASSDEDYNNFTYLISTAENSYFYMDYNSNPIVSTWLSKEWDVDGESTKINIEFAELTTGNESNMMNTLIATGEYQDVISMAYAPSNAESMYEEGMILDLTDLVNEYMPNYVAWMDEHPEYKTTLQTYVDGEYKILSIYGLGDGSAEPFCGFEYRRDWIVEYGTNPETGEPFTGGYTDDTCTKWEDDVVFPSGGSDPVYISDWEWMFDIFETALKDRGISEGYAYQLQPGVVLYGGDVTTGFGIGSYGWYIEDNECKQGFTSDQMRTYLEAMREWYKKGYIQKDFDENVDGMFWKKDTANVYAGNVGMWYGSTSSLGNQMDVSNGDESDNTYGICVYGAAQPINDVYGDLSTDSSTPTSYFNSLSMIGQSICITNNAADKNLPALLTALDYLYSKEGALLRTYGYSDTQQAELQNEFYNEHDLADGYYSVEERDGEEWYVLNPNRLNETGLETAAAMVRVNGLTIGKNTDKGYQDWYQHALEQWTLYDPVAYIDTNLSDQITADQADDKSLIDSSVGVFQDAMNADFVTGRTDIYDDAAWEAYCEEFTNAGVDRYCDYINEILQR